MLIVLPLCGKCYGLSSNALPTICTKQELNCRFIIFTVAQMLQQELPGFQKPTILGLLQLKKLELKLKTFSDLESMLAKECESVERARQKVYAEHARVVATRLGTNTAGSSVPSGTGAVQNQMIAARPAAVTFGTGGVVTPITGSTVGEQMPCILLFVYNHVSAHTKVFYTHLVVELADCIFTEMQEQELQWLKV